MAKIDEMLINNSILPHDSVSMNLKNKSLAIMASCYLPIVYFIFKRNKVTKWAPLVTKFLAYQIHQAIRARVFDTHVKAPTCHQLQRETTIANKLRRDLVAHGPPYYFIIPLMIFT